MKPLLTILLLIGLTAPVLADDVITGKVKAFGPGSLVTLYSEGDGPPRYFHLDEEATWENKAGEALNNKVVYPESTVTLYYEVEDETDKIVVNKVIVLVPAIPVATSAPQAPTETKLKRATVTTTQPVTPTPRVTTTDRDVTVESTAAGLQATEVVTTTSRAVNTQGRVVDFVPGKLITVTTTETADDGKEPVTYLIRNDAVFESANGEALEANVIRPGVPVTVYYTDSEDIRGVEKVVVRETVTTTTTIRE